MGANDVFSRLSNAVSRRDFLRFSGGCAALTSTSLMATILNLRMTHHAMAEVLPGDITDYRALVCVFLFGGNDSFQLLTPYQGSYNGTTATGEYGYYVQKRGGVYTTTAGGLALPKATDGSPPPNPATVNRDTNQLLFPISATNGREFGIHPRMAEIAELYQSGKACFVSNVGTLIDKTTRADYDAEINLPKGLFSHSDEQRNWQTGLPQSRSAAKGWAGRIADCLSAATNGNSTISMNIALNKINILQSGQFVFPYIVSEDAGAVALTDYPAVNNTFNRIRTAATDSLMPVDAGSLDGLYAELLQRTHARNSRDAIDAAIEFNNLTSGATPFDPVLFDNIGTLGDQAEMVARIINARGPGALNQKRQMFFISLGGFDNHDELINNQNGTLRQVSQSIHALHTACEAMGVADKVTIFTASDFSRTLSSNGNGADHAYGANHLVVGGGVHPDVWGSYPASLTSPYDSFAGNLDLGRGRLLPTLSVDEYAAELALWFGVPNGNDLETVLPNIRNFFGTSGSPIGFLA
ncbi:MAG: DUF1501 domain-containing protein [Planctomycetota bacterium]